MYGALLLGTVLWVYSMNFVNCEITASVIRQRPNPLHITSRLRPSKIYPTHNNNVVTPNRYWTINYQQYLANIPKETLLSQALKHPKTFDFQRFNPYSAYYLQSKPDSRAYVKLNRNDPIELRLWYICSPLYGCTGRGALPIDPNNQLGEFAALLPSNVPRTTNPFPKYLLERQNIIPPNLFPSFRLQ